MHMPRFALLAALAAGCSPFGAEPSSEDEDEGAAVLRLDLATSSLGAKSLLFAGTRRTPADPKYPCATTFATCVDLEASLASIRGLCPSVNLAPGTTDPTPSPWDFDVAVFDGEGCSGGSADVVCYDASSLGVAGTENKVRGAILEPGANSTQVICVAKPTSAE